MRLRISSKHCPHCPIPPSIPCMPFLFGYWPGTLLAVTSCWSLTSSTARPLVSFFCLSYKESKGNWRKQDLCFSFRAEICSSTEDFLLKGPTQKAKRPGPRLNSSCVSLCCSSAYLCVRKIPLPFTSPNTSSFHIREPSVESPPLGQKSISEL